MPTPPILEFDELIQAIPGDEPAGVPCPYVLRQQLEDARKEENPEDYDADDPRRPEQAKRADWQAIIRLSRQSLTETSKDLLLSARLTEGLTRQQGFAGLRDGLHLMRLLVEQCWDRVHPTIEDGDLEVRAAPFNWLDDPERGARFPHSVRLVPLLFGHRTVSWMDWRLLTQGKGEVTQEDFEKVVIAMPVEQCRTTLEDIDASLAEIDGLYALLGEKLGSMAPGFTSLRPAIADCRTLVQQVYDRKAPAASAEENGAAEGEGGSGEGGGGGSGRRGASRNDLYRQLLEISTRLQQLEPHSPIPYLISKAVELGALPFPLLMKALIRDDNVLNEMNRELGIKPPTE